MDVTPTTDTAATATPRTWQGEPLGPAPLGRRRPVRLLAFTLVWAAFVLFVPGIPILLALVVTGVVFGGAVLITGLWVRARGQAPTTSVASRAAFWMVPVIVGLTVALTVLDWQGGHRDAMRWHLSRDAFESAAAELALADPEAFAFHDGGRLLGLIWVDSIEVYGDAVLFNLPGYIDHAVIARERGRSVRAMFEAPGRRLDDEWSRYWFHF